MTAQSSHGGMTVGFEEITPALAREYLGKLYTRQRRRYAQDVQKWAGEMLADRWKVSADCVTFDVNDELINGQNRLAAIVESDTTHTFIVLRGAPTDIYEISDQVRVRSTATILGSRDEKNVTCLAGALNLIARWSRHGSTGRRSGISTQHLLALLDEHPTLRESVPVAVRTNKLYKYSPSNIAAMRYLFGLVDKDSADLFFDQLERQTAPEGSPVWHLQRVLTKRMSTGKKHDDFYYLALIIQAWNAHVTDTGVRSLQRSGGAPWPAIFDPYCSLDKIIGAQS